MGNEPDEMGFSATIKMHIVIFINIWHCPYFRMHYGQRFNTCKQKRRNIALKSKVEVPVRMFLNSAADGTEWSDSLHRRFTQTEMVPGRKELGGLRRRSGDYTDEKNLLPQLRIEGP